MYPSRIAISCVSLLFLLAVPVAAEFKVAVVNTAKAMMDCEEAKAAFVQIEADFSEEQKFLRDLNDEIVALEDRLQKDVATLTDDERRRALKEIDDKKLDFEYRGQRFQKSLKEEQDLLLEKLTPKFNAVLRELVELEGYDVVYNYELRTFLYVNPKHDITRKVTEKLNDLAASES